MRDPLTTEQTTSTTSRGLCEDCARYDWLYHLTRHVPSPIRNSSFQCEDALVTQAIGSGQAAYVEKVDELRDEKWCRINHEPSSGSYYTNEGGDETWFKLRSLRIPMHASLCSFS
jgi:hypothetical protein